MKRSTTALGICLLMLMGGVALANTHTWDNEDLDNSYWSSGDNWDPDQVPACADTARMNVGSTSLGQPELTQDEKVTNFETYGGSSVSNDVELDLYGYTLEVVTQWTVGNSGSTNATYVEIRNDSTTESDPGELVAAKLSVTGPASGGGNSTTLSVVPGGTNTTTVRTATVSGCS